jgi:hypothetical protein
MLAPSCAFRYHDAHQDAKQVSEKAEAIDHFVFGARKSTDSSTELGKLGFKTEYCASRLK